VLVDLLPSALVVLLTVALDAAALHLHGSLAPHGALADTATSMSAVSVLTLLGLPGAVRRGVVQRAGIREVDAMTGDEFEARLAALYRAMGYEVCHTGRRGDFGADLVVERDGERAVVQAKRYRGAVGLEAVQQAAGAARYYDTPGAAVVTNSTCTPAARSLAAASGVCLVERQDLIHLLSLHSGRRSGAAAVTAFVVQLLDGVRLSVYGASMVLRLAWWLARLFGRGLRAVWRSAG
jgi:restriction system protein